jgi:hypothetical protein
MKDIQQNSYIYPIKPQYTPKSSANRNNFNNIDQKNENMNSFYKTSNILNFVYCDNNELVKDGAKYDYEINDVAAYNFDDSGYIYENYTHDTVVNNNNYKISSFTNKQQNKFHNKPSQNRNMKTTSYRNNYTDDYRMSPEKHKYFNGNFKSQNEYGNYDSNKNNSLNVNELFASPIINNNQNSRETQNYNCEYLSEEELKNDSLIIKDESHTMEIEKTLPLKRPNRPYSYYAATNFNPVDLTKFKDDADVTIEDEKNYSKFPISELHFNSNSSQNEENENICVRDDEVIPPFVNTRRQQKKKTKNSNKIKEKKVNLK